MSAASGGEAGTAFTDIALVRGAERALAGVFGLGLLGVAVLGALEPSLVWIPPLLLIGAAGLLFLWGKPVYHLAAVLFGFLAVFDYAEGIQIHELAFGVYYLAYLAAWFLYHTFVRRASYVQSFVDVAVLGYLIVATASLLLVPFVGSDLVVAVSQWTGMVVLGFYFPIKHAVAQSPKTLGLLLLVFAAVVVVVTVRNFLYYLQALQNAEALWEIMQNRARTNERQIMVGLIGGLTFLLYYTRSTSARVVLVVFCFTLTAGVVVGQSRAIWVSMMLALGVMLFMMERRQRVRLVVALTSAVAVLLLVGFIAFNNLFEIILTGLSTRFVSLGTAATQDLSLVNRFYEWEAVVRRAVRSPLFGWGMGAEYSHFSLVFDATHEKAYVHNTYIGILFRHGVLGLSLFATFFLGSFVLGARFVSAEAARRRGRSAALVFATALACTAAIPGLALAAMTEGMMLNADGVFVLVYPLALLAGLRHRAWDLVPAVPDARR
ncbi:MAG: O-antigen ligase family protein [Bacteroidota bacterium]